MEGKVKQKALEYESQFCFLNGAVHMSYLHSLLMCYFPLFVLHETQS